MKHIFITKFGIYTANTAAIFVTLALKLKKIVTLLVFVRFLCYFYQIVGNMMKFKKERHTRALEKGNRVSHPPI